MIRVLVMGCFLNLLRSIVVLVLTHSNFSLINVSLRKLLLHIIKDVCWNRRQRRV